MCCVNEYRKDPSKSRKLLSLPAKSPTYLRSSIYPDPHLVPPVSYLKLLIDVDVAP